MMRGSVQVDHDGHTVRPPTGDDSKSLRTIRDPTNCLPVEILLEIWKISIVEESASCQTYVSFPWVASWVSRRWRNVALNTPTLWTEIYIDRYTRLPRVQTQFTRSGTCLLDLIIYFVSNPEEPIESLRACEPLIRDFMDVVTAHVDRWRSLGLTIFGARSHHGERIIDIALVPLRYLAAPRLTELSLTFCLDYSRCGPLLTGGTPVLRRLRLNGLDLKGIRNLFSRLTFLDIEEVPLSRRPTLDEFIDMLKPCADTLLHLSIDGAPFQIPFHQTTANHMIKFSSLASLSLALCDESWDRAAEETDFIGALFSVLSAPRLQAILLEEVSHLGVEAFIATIGPAVRGGIPKFPDLEVLSLCDVVIMDPVDHRNLCPLFLLCFPTVVTLEVCGGDSWAILACLTSEGWINCQYPISPSFRLKTLVCPRIPAPYGPQLLRQFVEGRKAAGRSITRLCVDGLDFQAMDAVVQQWLCGQVEVVVDSREPSELKQGPFEDRPY